MGCCSNDDTLPVRGAYPLGTVKKKTFFNKHSVCFLLKPVAEHAEKCNAAYSLRTFTCLTGCRDKDSGKNSPHLKIVFPLASQLTILI